VTGFIVFLLFSCAASSVADNFLAGLIPEFAIFISAG